MYAVFLETNNFQYLLTSSSETGLIHSLAVDIEENKGLEDFEVLQLHVTHNNSFNEKIEARLETMIQTLKTEKENECKL